MTAKIAACGKTVRALACGTGVAISAFMAAHPAWAIEKGDPAPRFDLAGPGGPVRLSDYQGKVVYLDFWASWCGPCKQSFPWLNEMQSRYGGKGLRVVGVSVDQKIDDAKAFLKGHPAMFDVAYDQAGAVPRAYAIKGMPTSVLIGPDGKAILVHVGFREDQRGFLESRIREALGAAEK